jgi:hypothetical protein
MTHFLFLPILVLLLDGSGCVKAGESNAKHVESFFLKQEKLNPDLFIMPHALMEIWKTK